MHLTAEETAALAEAAEAYLDHLEELSDNLRSAWSKLLRSQRVRLIEVRSGRRGARDATSE